MAYTEHEFFEKIKPYVIEDMKKSNILASLTASQARLESNIGNSLLTVKANNLFGIKGKYNGQYVTMPTTEIIKGVRIKVNADFRKYPTWLESISDHSDFLLRYKRYASIIGEKDYKKACKKMSESGYATANSSEYYNSLVKIIERNKLYEWDTGIYIPALIAEEYKIGNTYTTQSDLYIRDNPDGEKVKFDCITYNAMAHSKFDDCGNSILNKGTRVTCKAVKKLDTSIWIQIPSGWICAISKGKKYVI